MANNNEVFPVDENDTDVCVTLELDNGETLECEILTIFDVEDQDYIALLPVDQHGTPLDEEVIIYRYAEDEEGAPILDNIESDEEFEAVSKVFDQMLEDASEEE